jgi:putative ABC transport system permease protein
MKYMPLVWSGIWRRPVRTALIFLSISTAFSLFGLLSGIDAAFTFGASEAHPDRMTTISRISYTESLPYGDLEQIERVVGVERVTVATFFSTYFRDRTQFVPSFPVDPASYFDLYPEYELPAPEMAAWEMTRTGAVVGMALSKKYGWHIGDHVTLHSTIYTKEAGGSDWEFDIVGVYDDAEDSAKANSFFFQHAYFEEARAFGKGTVGWYILRIRDPTAATRIGEAIDDLFINSSYPTTTLTEREFQQSYLAQMGDINFLVVVILISVLSTLLFVIANSMMRTARERTTEIAILKTLGYGDGLLLALSAAECLIVCIAAGSCGLAIAAAIFPMMYDYVGNTRIPPSVFALGLGVSVALALLVSIPAMWRVRRLKIVEGLAQR